MVNCKYLSVGRPLLVSTDDNVCLVYPDGGIPFCSMTVMYLARLIRSNVPACRCARRGGDCFDCQSAGSASVASGDVGSASGAVAGTPVINPVPAVMKPSNESKDHVRCVFKYVNIFVIIEIFVLQGVVR